MQLQCQAQVKSGSTQAEAMLEVSPT